MRMKRHVIAVLIVLLGAGVAGLAPQAQAQGEVLTLYMGNPEPVSKAITAAFEQATGIKTAFVRLSAGEVLNRLRAERARPQASIVYGIGLSTIQVLKSDGLLEAYRAPNRNEIAQRYRDHDGFWTTVDIDFIGLAVNKKIFAEKRWPAPKSWQDLVRSDYRGQIAWPNPGTSGTALTWLYALTSALGEDKAFEYFKQFNPNVSQYTRSGIGPTQMTGSGEAAVGLGFAHDILGFREQGFPIEMIVPAEGTGYDLFTVVMVRGAPQPQAARKFIDWALTPAAQELLAANNYFDLPSHPKAKVSPVVVPYKDTKLISLDFWGLAKKRDRLVKRYQDEVLSTR